MQKIITLALALILCACATSGNSNRTVIPVDFSANTYNSVSNTYMSRPTVVEYTLMNNGNSWLSITMDIYGKDQYGNQKTALVTFVRENCDQYISLIDKYLEWEKTATQDQDVISKNIGKAKGQIFNMEFNFHSGNASKHYLTIGLWGSDHQYYDKAGAIKLKAILTQYRDNQLKSVDANTKYK